MSMKPSLILITIIFYLHQSYQQTNKTKKNQQKVCPVEKYAFDGDGVVEYHSSLPKMEQFTLCAWMRFTNHSGDHTIFTYSGEFFRFFLSPF